MIRPYQPRANKRRSNAAAFVVSALLAALLLAAGWWFIEAAANPVAPPTSAPHLGTDSAEEFPKKGGSASPTLDIASVTQNNTTAAPRASTVGIAPRSDDDTLAWQAVERIDAKVANALTLMTFFVTIIVVLLGLYEFFKLRELGEIARTIDDQVSIQFDRQFLDINKQYEKKLSDKLSGKIKIMTADIADDHLQLASIGHRVLLSYVINDLPSKASGVVSIHSMRCYIELERALGELRIASDVNNLTGLTLLHGISAKVSAITAISILHYLLEVRRMKLLSSWTNKELCDAIVSDLEKATGVLTKDVEAASHPSVH